MICNAVALPIFDSEQEPLKSEGLYYWPLFLNHQLRPSSEPDLLDWREREIAVTTWVIEASELERARYLLEACWFVSLHCEETAWIWNKELYVLTLLEFDSAASWKVEAGAEYWSLRRYLEGAYFLSGSLEEARGVWITRWQKSEKNSCK